LPLASERTRSNYTEELAHDEHVAPAPVPTPSGSEQQTGLGTTLGESVHERESSRRPARPRSATLPVAGGALLLGIAAAVAWKLSAPAPAPLPAESAQRTTASEPPVAPPTSIATAMAVEPSASNAPASPRPAASTALSGSVPAPLSSASAGVRPTAQAPKSLSIKRTPRATDRPELAPR
jgi:hypothetical protein